MKIKALQVYVDQRVVATVSCSPGREPIVVTITNIARTTMLRADVLARGEEADLQWQLPDLREGQVISFQIVNVEHSSCTPAQFVVPDDAYDQ